jgi:hypothetical protein
VCVRSSKLNVTNTATNACKAFRRQQSTMGSRLFVPTDRIAVNNFQLRVLGCQNSLVLKQPRIAYCECRCVVRARTRSAWPRPSVPSLASMRASGAALAQFCRTRRRRARFMRSAKCRKPKQAPQRSQNSASNNAWRVLPERLMSSSDSAAASSRSAATSPTAL